MPYQNRNNSPMSCFMLILFIYYCYSFNLTYRYIKYKYATYAVDQICLLRMCLGCSVLFRALYCFQSLSSTPCQNFRQNCKIYFVQLSPYYKARATKCHPSCKVDTPLCDKVYQLLTAGLWFSPGTPVSSTNKSDRHDITEIVLNTIL